MIDNTLSGNEKEAADRQEFPAGTTRQAYVSQLGKVTICPNTS